MAEQLGRTVVYFTNEQWLNEASLNAPIHHQETCLTFPSSHTNTHITSSVKHEHTPSHTHTHVHAHTHTRAHAHTLLLLGCWRCFHRFDEFLADALSLPAECVPASPPPPPLLLSPLSTQSLHPSVLRPGPGGGRSAPRSVLWVLSGPPPTAHTLSYTHICLTTLVRTLP